ncbi:SLAM family member 9 [Bos mutus]
MGFSFLWSLLLLGLLIGPGASRAPMVVTGILGGSVTLPLQLQDGQQVESISWVSRSVPGAIATVTLVEAGGPDTFHQEESRYWGRLSVVGPDRSLQISHLNWADAGSYRAHVNLRSSRLTHTREYSLHVYEPLAQPRVTVSTRISGNGHCLIILTCVAESRGGTVTYSWAPLGPQTAVSHGGSVLSVSLRPGDSALNFTCMVKNPVSNSSSLPILVPPSCTERPQEPKITASSQIMKDGTCFITLACLLDQAGEDVQYSWDPQGQGAVVSHGGTTLSISWRSGVSDSYHCTVKNPVSQSSSSISVKPLCSGSFLPCCLRKEFLLFLILGALQIKQI